MGNDYKQTIAGIALFAAGIAGSYLLTTTFLNTDTPNKAEVVAQHEVTQDPIYEIFNKANLTHKESEILQNNAKLSDKYTLLTEAALPPEHADLFKILERANDVMNEHYGLDMNIPLVFVSTDSNHRDNMAYSNNMDSFIIGENVISGDSPLNIPTLLSHETQHRVDRFLGYRKAYQMALDYFDENHIRPVCNDVEHKNIVSINSHHIVKMKNGVETGLYENYGLKGECATAAKEYLYMRAVISQNKEINADVGAVITNDEHDLIYLLEKIQQESKPIPPEIRQYISHPDQQERIDLLTKASKAKASHVQRLNESRASLNTSDEKNINKSQTTTR